MKIIHSDEYEFNSGKKVYANKLIIGINDKLNLFEGYDGGFDELTREEKIELADYMIARWGEYKEKAQKL